ncbi:MAG TPA: DUF1697 domain-containing protein [Candidatus Eisenbacteria bacterium]|nr:DUF1697 domain-containing protein [Candidatus Eisenbacteria bacterium]
MRRTRDDANRLTNVTDRRVALLRGINVGKAKRVAMADLRQLFEVLGYDDVRTLLNSGNVVFTVRRKAAGDLQEKLSKAVAERTKVSCRIVVLDAAEVAEAVAKNPLAAVAKDPTRLLLIALRDTEAATALQPLVRERWAPESFALRNRIAYLWCAKGIAESPLWEAVNRAIGDSGTARNLATMTKLLSLLQNT